MVLSGGKSSAKRLMRHNPLHLYYQSSWKAWNVKAAGKPPSQLLQCSDLKCSRRKSAINDREKQVGSFISATSKQLQDFGSQYIGIWANICQNTHVRAQKILFISVLGGQYPNNYQGPTSDQFHHIVHFIRKLMLCFFMFELNQCPKPGWETERLLLPGANTHHVVHEHWGAQMRTHRRSDLEVHHTWPVGRKKNANRCYSCNAIKPNWTHKMSRLKASFAAQE